MPNRVDTPINGIPPSSAERPDARQRNPDEAATQRPERAEGDQLEISQEARDRVQAERPTAGGPAEEAANTDDSTAPARETGQQGPSSVNSTAARRAEQLREQRTGEQQQIAAEPRERQGNLVDVTG